MLQPDAPLPNTVLQENLAATLALHFFSQVRPCIDAKLLQERSGVHAGREATEHANLDLTRRQPQFYSLASPVMEAQYCQLCESLSGRPCAASHPETARAAALFSPDCLWPA